MQPEFILQPALLWLLLLDLVLFGVLIAVRPGALLRPSVFFSVFMCVTINVAAATVDKAVYGPVTTLHAIRLSALLLPLAMFIWVLATPQLTAEARSIAGRCRAAARSPQLLGRDEQRAIVLLSGLMVLALLAYLATVPLTSTGLWSILFDPASSVEARERSLKMLDLPIVGYLYVFSAPRWRQCFSCCAFSRSPAAVPSPACSLLAWLCCVLSASASKAPACPSAGSSWRSPSPSL